jgi:hypothetical protein
MAELFQALPPKAIIVVRTPGIPDYVVARLPQ